MEIPEQAQGKQRREELQWKAGNVRHKKKSYKLMQLFFCGGYRPTFAVFNEI